MASFGCTPTYGVLLPIGDNTITCTATDNQGNTASASYTITVILQSSSDTTPSQESSSLNIAVPPDFTAYATNSTGQSYHMYYDRMANHPLLYSGIQDASWNAFKTGSEGNHMKVTDSNGNVLHGEDLASYGCTPGAHTLLPIGEILKTI